MELEKNARPEVPDEEQATEVSNEMLEGVSGGIRFRHKVRKKQKPDPDTKPGSEPDDGSGGATYTW